MKHTLVAKFAVLGNLCYLSHHETFDMMQRAFVRAVPGIAYSQGFNPRPRIFLPLPRTVGVESTEELLYAFIEHDEFSDTQDRLAFRIARQLPGQCRLENLVLAPHKISFQPLGAVYVFEVSSAAADAGLHEAVEKLDLALRTKAPLFVCRRGGPGKQQRNIDVAGYIENVHYLPPNVSVSCSISPQGTVRVDEIMHLLNIAPADLVRPVRREKIRWEQNLS